MLTQKLPFWAFECFPPRGQLYVAASRARGFNGLFFMLGQTEKSSEDTPCLIDNVVYQSALIH